MTRNVLLIIIAALLIVALFFVANLDDNPLVRTLRRADLTIRWTTENELDVVGFNLYRSDAPDGPFEKINGALIPASTDPLVGGEHTFVDENVVRGQTYYYQLETVDRQGNLRREGPFAIDATN